MYVTLLFTWKSLIQTEEKSVVFPLAEEQKKRKTFFSLTAGSMGSSVQGVLRSRDVSEFSCFVAFCHCLTQPPPPTHPPCVYGL